MKFKRIFLINYQGLGVGEAIDSEYYQSENARTLGNLIDETELFIPNLEKLGLINTLTMENKESEAYYTIARPKQNGTNELIMNLEMLSANPSYDYKTQTIEPFKRSLLETIAQKIGIPIIGNIIANDNQIINQLIERHIETHALIIYTTGDSNMIIAALDTIISESKLHEYAEIIRTITSKDEILTDIITKTISKQENYYIKETHHYTLPNNKTILDNLIENNKQTISIGILNELLKGNGINKKINAKTTTEAINKLIDIMDKNFEGLCIATLKDFEEYAHSRNIEECKKSLEEFDVTIPIILNKLNIDDLLIITSSTACDPLMPKNNNTRENVPVLIYSRIFQNPHQLDIMDTLSSIGATIQDILIETLPWNGTSYKEKLK